VLEAPGSGDEIHHDAAHPHDAASTGVIGEDHGLCLKVEHCERLP